MLISILPKEVELASDGADDILEKFKHLSDEELMKESVELAREVLKEEEERQRVKNFKPSL